MAFIFGWCAWFFDTDGSFSINNSLSENVYNKPRTKYYLLGLGQTVVWIDARFHLRTIY